MQYCNYCGKDIPEGSLFCAHCGRQQFKTNERIDSAIDVPRIDQVHDSSIGKTCPYCQVPIKPGVAITICAVCGSPHHAECWKDNGSKCTTYGCSGKTETTVLPQCPVQSEIERGIQAFSYSAEPDTPVRKSWISLTSVRIAFIAVLIILAGLSVYLNGNMTWTSSDGTYSGQVRWGKRHGMGTLVAPDGSRYTSNWVNGFAQGPGELILPNGEKYTGTFDMAKKQASVLLGDGSRYEGGFENNRFNGKGTLIRPNGTKYAGSFINGKKSGAGIIQTSDGKTFQGEFRDDELEGKTVIKNNSGEIIEGKYTAGRPDGEFRRFPANDSYNGGFMYVSHWRNGTQFGSEETKSPISVVDIRIRNINGGNVINDWNSRFPKAQIRFITYEAEVSSLSPHPISGEILVKYLEPSGYISRNSAISPPGGSFMQKIDLSGNLSASIGKGWGNADTSSYSYGRHYIQFFWQGMKIGEAYFDVY